MKGKTEKRTRWREQSENQRGGEGRRNGRLVGAAHTREELAEWRRLQRKNLEHTGPAEKECVASVPQNEQLARIPELPLLKEKGTEPSVQIIKS